MKIPAILVTSLLAWGLASGDLIESKSQAYASANADVKDMRISVPFLKKRNEHYKDIDKSVFDIRDVVLSAVGKINGAPNLGLDWKEVSIWLEKAKANAATDAETLAIIKKIVAHRDEIYLNDIKLTAEASANALAVSEMAEQAQKIAEAKGKAASQAILNAIEASTRAQAAAAATIEAIDRTLNNAKSSNAAQTNANGRAENLYRDSVAALAILLNIAKSSENNDNAATGAAASAAAASALEAKANAASQVAARAASKASSNANEAQATQSSALRNQQLAVAMLEKANVDQQAASAKVDSRTAVIEAEAAAQASSINAFRDGIVVGLGNDGGASAQAIAQADALARAGQKGHKIIAKKGTLFHKIGGISSASAEASSSIIENKW